MKRNQLGCTGIEVSALCLGSMTFGSQTPEGDAHLQMDMSLDAGIDFWDTAEMYPVNPVSADWQGRSEEIFGAWFDRTGRRKEVVLATKHSGEGLKIVREGARISSKTIPEAIEGSLNRLKTDYIDLYQFHWPNRGSYCFRQNWTFDPSQQDRQQTLDEMNDALEALQKEVDRGTIRAFGLSNESAWGTSQWLRIAEDRGLPRVASLQNEYSLLHRIYDTDVAEMCVNEDVGMLSYSPLGAGFLTGKYQNGIVPEGSRMAIGRNLGGRKTARAFEATQAYLDLATAHNLDPIHMSLAWCMQRPFMASTIFGATTADQLKRIIAGKDLVLDKEIMREIDRINRKNPLPF